MKKRPRDINQYAKHTVDLATGEISEPVPTGAELRGIARAKSLSAERRREIGKKAAAARWGKTPPMEQTG